MNRGSQDLNWEGLEDADELVPMPGMAWARSLFFSRDGYLYAVRPEPHVIVFGGRRGSA
jgi:hypothetical protein